MKYSWLILNISYLLFLVIYVIICYLNPPEINLFTLGIIIGFFFTITILNIIYEIDRLRRYRN
ncbi:MAG: hypothetical protein WC346_17285 [Methanogenium sp.]|jgi:hypothetical protein